jgi:GNAT superfamily N-acetyltransferase
MLVMWSAILLFMSSLSSCYCAYNNHHQHHRHNSRRRWRQPPQQQQQQRRQGDGSVSHCTGKCDGNNNLYAQQQQRQRPLEENNNIHKIDDSVVVSTSSSTGSSSSTRRNYYTHSDIRWKLGPPRDASVLERLQWSVSAASQRNRNKIPLPPRVYIPSAFHQAMLEAYCSCADENDTGNNTKTATAAAAKSKKIGRFGILTQPGPSTPELEATVETLFPHHHRQLRQNKDGDDPDPDDDMRQPDPVRAGAILCMFVEPEHRGRNVGTLALEVIRYIHAVQGCEYTILVADDRGRRIGSGAPTHDNVSSGIANRDDSSTGIAPPRGRLVQWYERNGGYRCAPLLQEAMGSPNGEHGITMIAPTRSTTTRGDTVVELSDDCAIAW